MFSFFKRRSSRSDNISDESMLKSEGPYFQQVTFSEIKLISSSVSKPVIGQHDQDRENGEVNFVSIEKPSKPKFKVWDEQNARFCGFSLLSNKPYKPKPYKPKRTSRGRGGDHVGPGYSGGFFSFGGGGDGGGGGCGGGGGDGGGGGGGCS